MVWFVLLPKTFGSGYRLQRRTPKTVWAIAKSSGLRSRVEDRGHTRRAADGGGLLGGGYMAESDEEDEGATAG